MPEPTPEVWAQIRYDYEHTDRPLAHICAENDITIPMLRYRMKRWDWRRRKPLVPRHGPPAVAVTQHEIAAAPASVENPPHPISSPCSEIDLSPQAGRGEEPAAIVPRLQSAVARVLPAIEATIARLAAGTQHPREMEQAGRTLSSLTRTLRELNALLGQHNARAEHAYDDDMPEDIDAFRHELARRIEALYAAEVEEAKPQKT